MRTLSCESLESREMLSTYYVATEGNNSYDGLAGTYDGTHGPWQTVAKVNGRTFAAGDSVLFKRGEVWREQLTISSSGNSGSQLTFGAYGSGANPEINAADIVSGWTLYSGDIWQATVSSSITSIPQIFLDGARQTLARSTGWSTIDATSTSATYLYDTSLTQPDNYWVGATAVIRGCDYSIDAETITASSSSAHTITWGSDLWTGNPPAGYGYYMENKFEQLDTAGEWYFDATTHTLYLQMPSGQNPNSHTIEASVRTYGVYAPDESYVTITDLSIKNAARSGIYVANGAQNQILSSSFTYCESAGMELTGGTGLLVQGNTVTQVHAGVVSGVGIYVNGVTYTSVLNNTISDIASDTTSPRWGEGMYLAGAAYSTISGNTLSNIAGHGIYVLSPHVTVSHNTLSRCVTMVQDNGAIYTSGDLTGTLIEYNRIDDCPGNWGGTPGSGAGTTTGLYMDWNGFGVTFQGNIVSGCSFGVHMNEGHTASVLNNTLYNNRAFAICFSEHTQNEMYGYIVKNNICYSVGNSSGALQIMRPATSTNPIGTLDYNLYYDPDIIDSVEYVLGSTWTIYTLADWKAKSGLDAGNDAHTLGVNPALVNVAGGDFHLTSSSPCIDAGAAVGLSEDFDGVAIPQNGAPDIGAYEFLRHPASVGVTSSAGPSTYGQTLTLTATVSAVAPVSGTPTGTVTFFDGATPLSAPVTLANGIASFTTSGLAIGNHSITAVYGGDADFAASTSAIYSKYIYTMFGDANLDGIVNGSDLGAVLANFNKTGMTWAQGDFNGDGTVNGADLGVVLANFNQSVALSAADVTPPTVTINQAGSQADPTSASPIHFAVVFSEPVSDFTAADVTLGGTALGKQVTKVSGSGTTYDVEVGGMTGSGTVVASIAAGKAHDTAGNPNTASTSTDNSVQYTLPSPSFALSGPISGTYQAGQTINIQWTAGNVKAGSKISLCYDADASFNKNEHWIEIDRVKAADGSGAYAWNTTGVKPGTYTVAGYMWDGNHTFTTSHLTQTITITVAPAQTFALSGPTSGTFIVGQSVSIQWMAGGVVSGGKISLCYDTDTTFNGNEKWIEIDGVKAADGAGSYTWNTAGVAPGTYYIAGYLYDGIRTFTTSHLTQVITIGTSNLTKNAASNSAKLAAANAVFANIGESLQSSVTNSAKVDWLYDV